MFQKVFHFFFRTTTGKVAGLLILALAAGYAARVALVDLPEFERKQAARAGQETIEAMADRLVQATSERPVDLPGRSEWYPADLPCDAKVGFTTPRAAVWDLLGAPSEGFTEFQYRFTLHGESGDFTLYARRDSDCDGLYAVWRLDWNVRGVLGREIAAQNILE